MLQELRQQGHCLAAAVAGVEARRSCLAPFLALKSSSVRSLQSPRPAGARSPVRLLKLTINVRKAAIAQTEFLGNPPVRKLFAKLTSLRAEQLEMEAGMGPVSWLVERSSSIRLARSPTSAGRKPVRLLFANDMLRRFVRLEREEGRDPEKALKDRLRKRRLVDEDREGGIGPLKAFAERSRDSRTLEPRVSGSLPKSLFEERLRYVRDAEAFEFMVGMGLMISSGKMDLSRL